ncbi:pterocarpan synthase 1-like [Magnolia sinica]|uniref:pterocarpan synthase 1-like n=1 Tax=Magnolia sinica TaxID=86752 RepID=UPI00265AA2D2|nr:pterocarpan synthase 1-like [Magnolia sinica]
MIPSGFVALLQMAQTTPKIWVSVLIFLLITIVGSLKAKGMSMKETNMVFYMQDWMTGQNVTSVSVAGLNGIDSIPSRFGTIVVFDDALTVDVDRHSKQIGRMRGMFAVSASDDSGVQFGFTIVFTDGEYKGSTLQIQGLEIYYTEKKELVARRELSVVSGTGLFRDARGYVMFENAFLDIPNFNSVLKLTLTVHHYTEFMTLLDLSEIY